MRVTFYGVRGSFPVAHPKVARTPAPRLGEHTRAILAEIGLASDAIDALVARAVVAAHGTPT